MTPAHLDMDKCMTIHLDYELPEYPAFEEGYRRAPRRESHLTEADKILAIKNALRYISSPLPPPRSWRSGWATWISYIKLVEKSLSTVVWISHAGRICMG